MWLTRIGDMPVFAGCKPRPFGSVRIGQPIPSGIGLTGRKGRDGGVLGEENERRGHPQGSIQGLARAPSLNERSRGICREVPAAETWGDYIFSRPYVVRM